MAEQALSAFGEDGVLSKLDVEQLVNGVQTLFDVAVAA
jgi:hypothetical protein